MKNADQENPNHQKLPKKFSQENMTNYIAEYQFSSKLHFDMSLSNQTV